MYGRLVRYLSLFSNYSIKTALHVGVERIKPDILEFFHKKAQCVGSHSLIDTETPPGLPTRHPDSIFMP